MFEISDEIKKLATKCENSIACTIQEKKELCKVESCVDNEVFFVKCLHEPFCPYKQTFGYSFFCTCPVRQEIFKKYKV